MDFSSLHNLYVATDLGISISSVMYKLLFIRTIIFTNNYANAYCRFRLVVSLANILQGQLLLIDRAAS